MAPIKYLAAVQQIEPGLVVAMERDPAGVVRPGRSNRDGRLPRRTGAWGDNAVSSCRSHSRATGPGTSAGAFSMARCIQGVLDGVPRGPVGPPGPLELAALTGAAISGKEGSEGSARAHVGGNPGRHLRQREAGWRARLLAGHRASELEPGAKRTFSQGGPRG